MSRLRLTPLDAHLPIYLTLTPPRQGPYPTLTKAARHLLDWLQSRSRRMPSPMWFGSAVHLAMLSNMPFARSGPALMELIDVGLVAVEREGADPPRAVGPAELQAAEPFALARLDRPSFGDGRSSGPLPMLEGPAREVWAWLEWLTGEGQGPRLLFPSLAHCASASGLSRERLYLGLRQLYDHGLVRFEQPPAVEREGGAA